MYFDFSLFSISNIHLYFFETIFTFSLIKTNQIYKNIYSLKELKRISRFDTNYIHIKRIDKNDIDLLILKKINL